MKLEFIHFHISTVAYFQQCSVTYLFGSNNFIRLVLRRFTCLFKEFEVSMTHILSQGKQEMEPLISAQKFLVESSLDFD
jgi:hypothetical protein